MLQTESRTIDVQSNLANSRTRVMGVDLGALASITNSMTRLYTDKETAALREYSTNGWDAHVKAGRTDRPIEVTLPGEFGGYLIVEDHGVGMSEDEIVEHYSQYGTSGKRDSNEYNGTYGFGCKAAFTLADQFTVVSVKDGRKTVALFSRDERGIGRVQIVSNTGTDQDSGTTVKIPYTATSTLEAKARRFFAVWRPGTVLVDGEAPVSIYDHALQVGPVWYLTNQQLKDCGLDDYDPRHDHKHVHVVMGNVPYPATNFGFPFNNNGVAFIDVAIGDVDIVPAREGLEDSAKTKQHLTKLSKEFTDGLYAYVQGLADVAPDILTATKIVADHESLEAFSTSGFYSKRLLDLHTYNGVKIRTKLAVSVEGWTSQGVTNGNAALMGYFDGHHLQLTPDTVSDVLAITGVPVPDTDRPLRTQVRRGLVEIMDDLSVKHVVCVPEGYANSWFDVRAGSRTPGLTVFTYEEYLAERKQYLTRPGGGRTKTDDLTYKTAHGGYVRVGDLKQMDIVGWYVDNRYAHGLSSMASLIGKALEQLPENLRKSFALIAVRTTQSDAAVRRRVPNAVSADDAITKIVSCLMDEVDTDEVAQVHGVEYTESRVAQMLGERAGEIEDEVLRHRVEVLSRAADSDVVSPLARAIQALLQSNKMRYTPTAQAIARAATTKSMFQRYPLLRSAYDSSNSNVVIDHALTYVNVVHQSAQQQAAAEDDAAAA